VGADGLGLFATSLSFKGTRIGVVPVSSITDKEEMSSHGLSLLRSRQEELEQGLFWAVETAQVSSTTSFIKLLISILDFRVSSTMAFMMDISRSW
jgi:hypothetical protein